MDINIITNKLSIKYYESIITTLDKQNINKYDWLVSKLDELQNGINNITETETSNKDKIASTLPVNNYDELYKKPWNKLNQIHKILKIKEFINTISNIKANEKDKLKNELIELVKNKILSKKEKVDYDENNGKIISIFNLQYKDNKYIYNKE